MERDAFYRVMNSVVVPRPIAWVCSRSADGVLNLAPHSFYTVACVEPPVVQFTSVGRKDSLRNVEATREFTVSLTPESLFEQINATATDFPPATSEAEACGVRLEPSDVVGVPRVAESPVAIECTLHSTVRLGDSTVVFGRVRAISAWESAVRDGRPRIEHLRRWPGSAATSGAPSARSGRSAASPSRRGRRTRASASACAATDAPDRSGIEKRRPPEALLAWPHDDDSRPSES